jgi:hypothetical protein
LANSLISQLQITRTFSDFHRRISARLKKANERPPKLTLLYLNKCASYLLLSALRATRFKAYAPRVEPITSQRTSPPLRRPATGSLPSSSSKRSESQPSPVPVFIASLAAVYNRFDLPSASSWRRSIAPSKIRGNFCRADREKCKVVGAEWDNSIDT